MNYFVVQVITGSEEKFIRLANNLLERSELRTTETVPSSGISQISTGSQPERELVELPKGFSSEAELGRLLWPRRKLTIRKKGLNQTSLAPIFPGYVFYEADEVHPNVYWAFRGLTGFVRFLKNEDSLEALGGEDRELLLHFLSFGEVVDKSLVYFDEERRIRVKSGPMKGLEGRIVKVDKRKRRAKIRLSIYSDRFLVDFGFELLESAEGNERQAN